MAEISVTSAGPCEFEVRVDEGDRETGYHVTVPESLIDEL